MHRLQTRASWRTKLRRELSKRCFMRLEHERGKELQNCTKNFVWTVCTVNFVCTGLIEAPFACTITNHLLSMSNTIDSFCMYYWYLQLLFALLQLKTPCICIIVFFMRYCNWQLLYALLQLRFEEYFMLQKQHHDH